MPIAKLDRTILSLKGDDVCGFLGGLITNSIADGLTYSALLTPQGKIIADFFIHKQSETHVFIETPAKFGKALMMRLKMYKLRAKIDLSDISDDFEVYALWDGEGDIGLTDPRLKGLGQRMIAEFGTLSPEHDADDYDTHRLALSIPESQWDFESEQVFPADINMDQLNGIDYKKGCFIGQEVASRMHRKTDVRKRMRGLKLSSEAAKGDGVFTDTRNIGTVFHVNGDLGMGLIRLDRLAKAQDAIMVNDHPVEVMEPHYGHTS
ncbi:MAG: folate-binding protein YgfZ [Robiginitomaculum sp.]|nr:MAG: folate-binding protein YgfZ [Robiginitomaculum sp.]